MSYIRVWTQHIPPSRGLRCCSAAHTCYYNDRIITFDSYIPLFFLSWTPKLFFSLSYREGEVEFQERPVRQHGNKETWIKVTKHTPLWQLRNRGCVQPWQVLQVYRHLYLRDFKGWSRIQRGRRVKTFLPAQSIESRVVWFSEIIEEELQLKRMGRRLPRTKNTEKYQNEQWISDRQPLNKSINLTPCWRISTRFFNEGGSEEQINFLIMKIKKMNSIKHLL